MDTIGWLFLVAAGFLIRAVSKGRSITDLPGDIGDAFTAAVSGDGVGLSAVLARTGSSLDPVEATPSAGLSTSAKASGASLLAAMHKRGDSAKGYRFGSTGPDYYDCSGLVWRACQDIGAYSGPRFTTATFTVQGASWTKHVDTPASGDIVLWPRHHIGVMSGATTFYSALGRKEGIKDVAVKGVSGTPVYYRLGVSVAPESGDPGNGLGVLK